MTQHSSRSRSLSQQIVTSEALVPDRAPQSLDDYLSMLVHELRGPLSVIAGYADILAALPLAADPSADKAIRAIGEQVHAGIALVDQILSASRIEGGGVEASMAHCDLATVVERVVMHFQPRAHLQGAVVEFVRPADVVAGCADPRFVELILHNLIGNSLLYCRRAPRVVVELEQPMAVVVRDNGTGVSSEMHERIFERFIRVEGETQRPGSGLGLYIARQLAQLMGARLVVRSSVAGEGSTFALEFVEPPVPISG